MNETDENEKYIKFYITHLLMHEHPMCPICNNLMNLTGYEDGYGVHISLYNCPVCKYHTNSDKLKKFRSYPRFLQRIIKYLNRQHQ